MGNDNYYLVDYRSKDFYYLLINLNFHASLFLFATNIAYTFLNVKKKVK